MILYTLAHICQQENDSPGSLEAARAAAQAAPDYCFPCRTEEQIVLESALRRNLSDAHAAYYLGNLYYDRRRHEEAIALWERSAGIDRNFPTAWRNLGIGYFNVEHDATSARDAFECAHAADPSDARILYERDQLWKQTGDSPENRLAELNKHRALCDSRDDLTVERAMLLNQTGEYQQALSILLGRQFQPWEGGEGLVLGQYVRSLLSLGEHALAHGSPGEARSVFVRALHPPENLGEAKHLLANQSDIWFWIGAAYSAEGLQDEAAQSWKRAAAHHGDFHEMNVRAVSGMTFWSALAMRCMGETKNAQQLFQKIMDHAAQLEQQAPAIDYFATSLPAMLLFESDLAQSNRVDAMFLRGQAALGLGRSADAEKLLSEVLKTDRNHLQAMELLRERSLIASIADLES
jgi:tetratricopeptide (TPR) repeat protein